jgi:hypothetical protein
MAEDVLFKLVLAEFSFISMTPVERFMFLNVEIRVDGRLSFLKMALWELI